MMIRALSVVPDAATRQELVNCLTSDADATQLTAVADLDQVARQPLEQPPQVLFIDAKQLLSSSDTLDKLWPNGSRPLLICVSSDTKHASAAFDHGALDYLQLPLQPTRVRQAVERARARVASRPAAEENRALRRFLVRTQDRLVVVPVEQVDWVESANNYIVLHAGRETHILRETLTNVEKRLPSGQFLRVSRFAVINLTRVRSFKCEDNGTHTAILSEGTEVPLTRGIREVQERLEFA